MQQWLSVQTCNAGKEIFYADACVWISKREYSDQGLSEIEARWMAYQEKSEKQKPKDSADDRQSRWDTLRKQLQKFVDIGWIQEIKIVGTGESQEMRAIVSGMHVRESALPELVLNYTKKLQTQENIPF